MVAVLIQCPSLVSSSSVRLMISPDAPSQSANQVRRKPLLEVETSATKTAPRSLGGAATIEAISITRTCGRADPVGHDPHLPRCGADRSAQGVGDQVASASGRPEPEPVSGPPRRADGQVRIKTRSRHRYGDCDRVGGRGGRPTSNLLPTARRRSMAAAAPNVPTSPATRWRALPGCRQVPRQDAGGGVGQERTRLRLPALHRAELPIDARLRGFVARICPPSLRGLWIRAPAPL